MSCFFQYNNLQFSGKKGSFSNEDLCSVGGVYNFGRGARNTKAKDVERAARGLDRSDAGSRYRKELDFVHRCPSRWFPLSSF